MKFALIISLAVLLLPGLAQAAPCCQCHHCPHIAAHHTKSARQLHHHHRHHAHGVYGARGASAAAALRYAESYYDYRSPSTVTDYGGPDEPAAGLILSDMRDFDGGVGYGTDGFSGTFGYGVWFEGARSFHRNFKRAAVYHGLGRMHHRVPHGKGHR
jgi:hypothetical protein